MAPAFMVHPVQFLIKMRKRVIKNIVGCLLIGCILSSCQNLNVIESFETPINVDSLESSITIPNLYINILDTGVVFHQDTLYFQAKKWSGFVFKLFPNKDTAFVGSYWNGLEEGVHQKWYPHYKLAEFRNYHLGKKVGKHIGFWDNGNPKFEYHFSDGELQGVSNEWYENGRPYKVMHYQKGYEAGSQKMWWENGVIRANYVVKQGRRYGLIGLKLCMTPKDSIDFKIN